MKDLQAATLKEKFLTFFKRNLVMARCESVALEKYKLWMNYISKTDVYPCGLVVNENNCWLGSSPTI